MMAFTLFMIIWRSHIPQFVHFSHSAYVHIKKYVIGFRANYVFFCTVERVDGLQDFFLKKC